MQQVDVAPTGAERCAVEHAPADAEALVVRVLQQHADLLLRFARKHSDCEDDAADAFQRGLEIFLRHSRRLEPETAHRWLYRVIRNEAASIRGQRARELGPVALDPDRMEARHEPSPEERVLAREARVHQAEALRALKGTELQALWLQASGRSYTEIAAESGWTHTKVNRALTEGRRRAMAQRADIVSGRECERWAGVLGALVAGEATARQLAEVRPHLRGCVACQARVRQLHRARPRAAAFLPAGLVSFAAHVQERAGLQLMKVQGAVDALPSAKLATVVASAAAITGGGATVVERTAAPSSSAKARLSAVRAPVARVPRSPAPRPVAVPTAGMAIPASTTRVAAATRPRTAAARRVRNGRPRVRVTTRRTTAAIATPREFAGESAAAPKRASPHEFGRPVPVTPAPSGFVRRAAAASVVETVAARRPEAATNGAGEFGP